jgi:hypothetical protein
MGQPRLIKDAEQSSDVAKPPTHAVADDRLQVGSLVLAITSSSALPGHSALRRACGTRLGSGVKLRYRLWAVLS